MVGKVEGKRLFGRPGRKWEDDIKIVYRMVFMLSPNNLMSSLADGTRV
jgi:hypothetical protein